MAIPAFHGCLGSSPLRQPRGRSRTWAAHPYPHPRLQQERLGQLGARLVSKGSQEAYVTAVAVPPIGGDRDLSVANGPEGLRSASSSGALSPVAVLLPSDPPQQGVFNSSSRY